MSQNRVFGARAWRRHATIVGFIVLATFGLPLHARGQAMSPDMPGMEHKHVGTPAGEPLRTPTARACAREADYR